ncbi:Hpt domain-containing protein [Marinoscillum furvescens]|uniref:HPt domain-containing protein n=1 Tax=Marinoscillum furvescens DSM 4134 TaxID=1122208 RepID=A0A3D9L5D6_MARFU|nr:Hpt domain-containing protein [Marinoscillum furvescens]RED99839.1 hypothetical protein C7460_107122 [Marinoscillum furvescens DSM 4134]
MCWTHLEKYLNNDFSYFSVGYGGCDPFIERVLQRVLDRHGLVLDHEAELCFTENQMEASQQSILISNWPNKHVAGWCKAPFAEYNLLNTMFYGQMLVVAEGKQMKAPAVEAFVGRGEDLKDTLADFLDGLITSFRQLVEAAYHQDNEAVRFIAHRMQSSLGYYPVGDLSPCLRELEEGQLVSHEDLLGEVFDRIHTLFASLVNEYF